MKPLKPLKTLLLYCALAALAAVAAGSLSAAPLGTAFNYQGRLEQNGMPATNGVYGMRFALFDAAHGSALFGTNAFDVPVTNGLFTATLDFGAAAFSGDARWLEIAVNTNTVSSAPGYATLLPRTRLNPTPYALYALYAAHAGTANTVTNGAIQAGHISAGAPSNGQVLGYNNGSLVWQTAGAGSGPWLLNNGNTYFSGGNVGIGTASPGALLHINSGDSVSSVLGALLEPNLVNGGFNQIYLGRTPTGNGCATFTYVNDMAIPAQSLLSLGLYSSSFTFNVRGDGNVGIGTTTPATRLDVNGDASFRNDVFVTRDLRLNSATTETGLGIFSLAGWAPVGLQPPTRFIVRREGTVGIGTATPQGALDVRGHWDNGRPALHLGGQKPTIKFAPEPASGNQEWLMHLGSDGPGDLQFMRKDGFIYASVLSLGSDENVGIGTENPTEKLHVAGKFLLVEGAGSELAYIGGDGIGGEVHVGSLNPDVTTVALYNSASSQYMHLAMKSCTIYGGADLAEPFQVSSGEIPKGSVVVIDPNNPGKLKRSAQAYDKRVAGIISGANGVNPGIALQQQGLLDGGQNVALSGRVYVQADASVAAIEPGDLLTTSDTPGHAMKVMDSAKAQGAILGKAMTALAEGKGFVLVLVTLQ